MREHVKGLLVLVATVHFVVAIGNTINGACVSQIMSKTKTSTKN